MRKYASEKDEIQEMEKVETPDIMGKTVREAEKVLKEGWQDHHKEI